MSKIERPGVYPKWQKGWKALRENGMKWLKIHKSATSKVLQRYARSGVVPDQIALPEANPPLKVWENSIQYKLSIWGAMRQFEAEMGAMGGSPYDLSLSVHAFATIYTHEMIDLCWYHMGPIRSPGLGGAGVGMSLRYLPYTALGVVVGCTDEALKLARLQISGFRKGRYGRDRLGYPIAHCILRLLGDYLGEPPIELIGNSLKEPIFNALFDAWREPDAASLVDICLAACDAHTQHCRADFEFSGFTWNRTPIEILLLFKLRQLLGLPNPVLDHPLMNTPLGKLPETEVAFSDIANGPDDLIYRVRQRLMQDGYDEEEIAGYYKD